MPNLSRESMPYRNCAGVVLFNQQGLTFVGQRNTNPEGDEGDLATPWQWPQGGIDKGEDHQAAAVRELYEETSVSSIKVLAQSPDWIRYDLPDEALGVALKGKYRGQQQKWFAVLLTGNESEINVLNPANGEHPAEFAAWKWVSLAEAVDLVVPFKRSVYQEVAEAFSDLPNQIRDGDYS